MSTSTETNIKRSEVISQSSQAMPATNELTVNEVKRWNTSELLKRIQENLVNSLKPEDEKKFLDADIDGEAFLGLANKVDFFISYVGLSPGASQKLAQLAKNLAESVKDMTIGNKSECCCSTYTLCRQAPSPTSCHYPRWLRHTATPDICTLHFHFYSS